MNDRIIRAGADYLQEHRPLWSYLPVISWIWTRGFVTGCAVSEEVIKAEGERRLRA